MNPKTKVIIRLQSLLANAHVNADARWCEGSSAPRTASCTAKADRSQHVDTDSTRALKKDGASAGGSKSKRNKTEGDSSPGGAGRVGERCSATAGDLRGGLRPGQQLGDHACTTARSRCGQDAKKPVAEIDEKGGIDDTVTGLAYCPATKTLWMASNSPNLLVYDLRSATDITPYLQQSDTSSSVQRDSRDRIQKPSARSGCQGGGCRLDVVAQSAHLAVQPHGACSIRARTRTVSSPMRTRQPCGASSAPGRARPARDARRRRLDHPAVGADLKDEPLPVPPDGQPRRPLGRGAVRAVLRGHRRLRHRRRRWHHPTLATLGRHGRRGGRDAARAIGRRGRERGGGRRQAAGAGAAEHGQGGRPRPPRPRHRPRLLRLHRWLLLVGSLAAAVGSATLPLRGGEWGAGRRT